jgi:hypothetical protein
MRQLLVIELELAGIEIETEHRRGVEVVAGARTQGCSTLNT